MKTLSPKKLLKSSQDETRNGLFALLLVLVVAISALVGIWVINTHNGSKESVARQSQSYEAQKNEKTQSDKQDEPQEQVQEQTELASPDNKVPTGTVLVYFSRYGENGSSDSEVHSVERTVYQGQDPLSVAVEELIAGPDSTEKADGYFGGIKLSGQSNCDNADYKITTDEQALTVRFCKDFNAESVTDTTLSQKQIQSTLSQLSGLQKITILDKNGKCLFGQTEACN